MDTKQITLEKDQNGKTKPVDALTGSRYQVHLSAPILVLERSYHDDSPVVGAAFELELQDGSIVIGNLDKNGHARILNLPSPAKRVRFKPDTRLFFAPPATGNPEYKAAFSAAEADVLAQEHASGPVKPDAKRKSMAGEAMDWVWGTVQGNFNDQQTTSQIIVDAVISAVPVVGEAADVRDIIAILLGMYQDPKKREDKWEWLGLVVVLLSLIPVLGGVIKGVGKLLLRALKSGGKVGNSIASYIGALNRIGWGDAPVWFKKLDLAQYSPEALGYFRKITQHMDDALAAIQKVPTWVLPGSVLATMRKLREELQEVKARGETMIPACVKALNGKLKEIQQQIFEGEWVPIGKTEGAKPKIKTREVEIKFENKKKGKKNLTIKNPHFPTSDPDFHYQRKEGWPDLKAKQFNSKESGRFWAIRSFSGPLTGKWLEPGKKIYRVGGVKTSMEGLFWLEDFPKNGKEWRIEFAVLERWSENGKYVEFTVPQHGLWVWEGKIASQLDDREWLRPGVKNPSYAQYLKGGQKQYLIDFDFEGSKSTGSIGNKYAQLELEKTHWEKTNWNPDDLKGIEVPLDDNKIERRMDELELEEKSLLTPFISVGEKGSRAITAKNIVESQEKSENGR